MSSHIVHEQGFIGRIGRLGIGIFALYYVYILITQNSPFAISQDFLKDVGNLIGLFFVVIVINDVVNIGWARKNVDNKPKVFVVSSITILGVAGLILSGQIFTSYLLTYVYFLMLYFYLHLGLSHIFAGIYKTPGCEMNISGKIVSKITNKKWKNSACNGLWSGVDDWEQAKKSKLLD